MKRWAKFSSEGPRAVRHSAQAPLMIEGSERLLWSLRGLFLCHSWAALSCLCFYVFTLQSVPGTLGFLFYCDMSAKSVQSADIRFIAMNGIDSQKGGQNDLKVPVWLTKIIFSPWNSVL